MWGPELSRPIKFDHDDDPTWYNGPPYALAEDVFDEDSIEGRVRAPKRRTFDGSGKTETVTVRPASRLKLEKKSRRTRRVAAST